MDTMVTSKKDFASHILFSHIAESLETISKVDVRKKAIIFEKVINSFRKARESFLANNGCDAVASFYPILRLLLPQSDIERESYGIKTKTLGKLFIKALAIGPTSDAAKKLTFEVTSRNHTDFGDIVYDVMRKRSPNKGSLSVAQVNQYLDLIGDHFKSGERHQIDREIVQMLNGMTAIDRKWLTRIILKKLNLKFGRARILQIYHKNAEAAFHQCGSLSRMCAIIENNEPIESVDIITPFYVIWPMLCERMNIENLQKIISENDYYLETKMDGERCQIHIRGNEFRYFSRNCNDFTTPYGSDPSGGNFTPVLAKLLAQNVESVILDGEMMVWDREEQAYHTKSEFVNARGLHHTDPKLNSCFCVYDILYLNSVSLLNQPYVERMKKLETILTERKGNLVLCKRTKVRDSGHILECLNNAIDDNEEGVVIKQMNSTYQPGKREKGGWFKIKPDYANGLVSDLDLLIIGGFFNKHQVVTRYLLAVHDKSVDNELGTFYAVSRVYSGLTHAQRHNIQEKLKNHWHKVNKNGIPPPFLKWNNYAPHVWIDPKHSIVLQVKATEFTRTSTFATKYTLRFPRVESVRDDKLWSQCCTLQELDALCTSNAKVQKTIKRHYTQSDIITSPKHEQDKITKRSRKHLDEKIYQNLTINNAKDVKLVDNICKGLQFCILNTDPSLASEDDLKNMVRKHGGELVVNPGPRTFICVAGRQSLRIQMLNNQYNIASVAWLIRALKSDEPLVNLLPLRPCDMMFATETLKHEFACNYDKYGDSYTVPVEEKMVSEMLNCIDIEELPHISDHELLEMELDLADNELLDYFRMCNGYFYLPESCNSHTVDLAKLIFKSKGGQWIDITHSDISNANLTHIFTCKEYLNEWKSCVFFGEIDKFKFIDCDWIIDCYNSNCLLPEENYVLA